MDLPSEGISSGRRTLLKQAALASIMAGASGVALPVPAEAVLPDTAISATSRRKRNAPMHTGRFDVHAHYVPPGVAQLKPVGGHFAATPMPQWSPEIALAFMDRHGIATQLLSVPVALPPAAAHAANAYGAQIVKQNPKRFGLLAALPMADIAATLTEIDHAFDTLCADGVIMMTNYAGDYLGHPKYEPVFAALDRRRAPVFVHPADPACFECVACGRPGPVIEFPMDTCRTVTDMLYAGVLRRFSSINFILSHGGGALPALAHRIASIGTLAFVPHPPEMTRKTALNDLSKLYFDTAIAGTASSIVPVLQLAGADHLVFGTDFPPATESVIKENIEALDGLTCMSNRARAAISHNGRRLFARFASGAEPAR